MFTDKSLSEVFADRRADALAHDAKHAADHAHAAQQMVDMGGSFAAHIGLAYQRADRANARTLEHAFADLFARYMPS